MKLRKGFTLVELLVVVAIIGVLVMIAIPRFANMTAGAQRAALNSNHRLVISAVTMYMAENNGDTPANLAALDDFLNPSELDDSPNSTAVYTVSATDPGSVRSQATIAGELVYFEWTP